MFQKVQLWKLLNLVVGKQLMEEFLPLLEELKKEFILLKLSIQHLMIQFGYENKRLIEIPSTHYFYQKLERELIEMKQLLMVVLICPSMKENTLLKILLHIKGLKKYLKLIQQKKVQM